MKMKLNQILSYTVNIYKLYVIKLANTTVVKAVKGDKGSKGDHGEKGATGNLGPGGKPVSKIYYTFFVLNKKQILKSTLIKRGFISISYLQKCKCFYIKSNVKNKSIKHGLTKFLQ